MSILQAPIGSGFTAASTADDVIKGINLSSKTAIVTGGYSGLGRETVRVFLKAGARVIVPARDRERALTALEGLKGVEVEAMDLLDPKSIDAFAAKFISAGSPLHILVNSAGIMANPLTRDARGYESQFATNHLGHFQLVAGLRPALKKAQGARVISVSSRGHRYSPVVFDDINFEHRSYDRWQAYGQSKTANILFAVALDERAKSEGIRAFSLHPGSIVRTGLEKYLSKEELIAGGVLDKNGNQILDPSKQLKTVEQGAATSVWCATSPQLNGMGGAYCENSDITGFMPSPEDMMSMEASMRPGGVMPYAIDKDSANRLWEISEKMIFGGK